MEPEADPLVVKAVRELVLFVAAGALPGGVALAPANAFAHGYDRLNSAVKRLRLTSTARPLYVSVFFDGTMNNRDIDQHVGMLTNIAYLSYLHEANPNKADVRTIYEPGIGTRHPGIGDEGGTIDGAVGLGGEARLDDAKDKLRQIVSKNPQRPIMLAVFGFSRGAGVARAYVNSVRNDPQLNRVKVYYLGLLDTVASAGVPTGSGVGVALAYALGGRSAFKWRNRLLPAPTSEMDGRTQLTEEETARVKSAFTPEVDGLDVVSSSDPDGAEAKAKFLRLLLDSTRGSVEELALDAAIPIDLPRTSPGHGHGAGIGWPGNLEVSSDIPVVYHMVALHEGRNTFPSESIYGKEVSGQAGGWEEFAIPGVHSDVGGGYKAGDSGIGQRPGMHLSMIYLRKARAHATRKGVPFIEVTPDELREPFGETQSSAADLREMEAKFASYSKAIGTSEYRSHPYAKYAWLFERRRREELDISRNIIPRRHIDIWTAELEWRSEARAIQAKINALAEQLSKHRSASKELTGVAKSKSLTELARLEEEHTTLLGSLKRLPKYDGSYLKNEEAYIDQLIEDARRVRVLRLAGLPLRPHYRDLVDAFERYYIQRQAVDTRIREFLGRYVHDSLSGFATDATLPSDPRVTFPN